MIHLNLCISHTVYVFTKNISFFRNQLFWGGGGDAEAMESLSHLASCLATSSNKAKAAIRDSLYGSLGLNLNLVKANATAILTYLLDALPRTCRLFRLGSYC